MKRFDIFCTIVDCQQSVMNETPTNVQLLLTVIFVGKVDEVFQYLMRDTL